MSDPKEPRPFLIAPVVIDWLQWGTFPERLDQPDYPQMALELIAEYKAELKKRDDRIAALEKALTDIIWSWENEGASMIENVLANLEASRKVKHE